MKRALAIMSIFILCIFSSFGLIAYKAGFFDVTDPAYVFIPLNNVERVCLLTIVCLVFSVMLLVVGDRGE